MVLKVEYKRNELGTEPKKEAESGKGKGAVEIRGTGNDSNEIREFIVGFLGKFLETDSSESRVNFEKIRSSEIPFEEVYFLPRSNKYCPPGSNTSEKPLIIAGISASNSGNNLLFKFELEDVGDYSLQAIPLYQYSQLLETAKKEGYEISGYKELQEDMRNIPGFAPFVSPSF